ncbi:MAG: serine/threonine-protein kinase [Polyangiaceae bacterium]
MSLSSGTVVGGDFKVVSTLAKGGMGEVYVAEQLSTNKSRALKVMKPELLGDPKLVARFEQEAKVGAMIASEHVVEVVAAGIDDDLKSPWLAMELLEGETLASMLDKKDALSAGEVRALFAQLGHALAAAHAAKIVHRDLKPENIFVAKVMQLGVAFKVKILDFGIAKLLEEVSSPDNKTGLTTLGTPRYMAPEQTGGQPITPATDVWALGLLAFECLTGKSYWKKAPEGTDTVVHLMREVLFAPLVPASKRALELGVASRLPQGFDAWFSRCVAREASDRFADAGEAVAGLDPILAKVAGNTQSPALTLHNTSTLHNIPKPQGSSPGRIGKTRPAEPHPDAMGAAANGASADKAAVAQPPPLARRTKLLIGAIAGGIFVITGAIVGGYYLTRPTSSASHGEEKSKSTTKNLDGVYSVINAREPNGRPYQGTARLTREGKTGYRIVWSKGYAGVGMVDDGMLAVAWGEDHFGVTVYKIDGNRLIGKYVTNKSAASQQSQTLEGPRDLDGTYTIVSSSAGDKGSIEIHPAGDIYELRATFETGVVEGVGIKKGERLYVGWTVQGSPTGVAVYEPEEGRLVGRWAMQGLTGIGQETLSKRKRDD